MHRLAHFVSGTLLFGLVTGSFPKVTFDPANNPAQASSYALRQPRLHHDGAPSARPMASIGEAQAASSARPHALLRIPGLLMGIFGMLLILSALACVSKWNRTFPGDKDAGERDMTCDDFQDLANNGMLDFYTCIALSVGRQKTCKAVACFIPRLTTLLCMQVILIVLLLVYQSDHHFFPQQQGQVFRVIGGMLFAYSAMHLHNAMHDDCRENIVHMMRSRQASGWYLWPILLGESVNTFVATFLMGILFLIFCDCTRPQELLINCLAINFVADIDNRLVGPEDIKQGVSDFRFFRGAWEGSRQASQVVRESSAMIHRSISQALGTAPPAEEQSSSSLVDILQTSVLHMNIIIRLLVPIAAGILTFLFVFANNQPLCNQMREVEPWPFCLELSG